MTNVDLKTAKRSSLDQSDSISSIMLLENSMFNNREMIADREKLISMLTEYPEILDEYLANNPDILKRIVFGYKAQKFNNDKMEFKETSKDDESGGGGGGTDYKQFKAAPPVMHNTGKERKKTKRELMSMNQTDMFMELIRDIANELDVNTLCFKIMINVTILTSCDRGSLFLARGTKEKRYLVSKLFDVTETSNFEDVLQTEEKHITIQFGHGIVGSVAETKEPINIKNAYEDARFNKAIDLKTGFRTKAILCMPILDYENEVMGVAQIINKNEGDEIFTEADEEIFKNYLTFCGIGLTNAQMFEISVSESKQNKLLLSLAKGIFSEPTSLEKLVQRIMIDAQSLIHCFKSCIYLINKTANDSGIVKAFEMNSILTTSIILPSRAEIEISDSASIALEVAKIGRIDNQTIKNEMRDYDGFRIKTILSAPIFDGDRNVIGVVQMMNREDGKQFSDNDINTVETFSIFCGLGMHNCQMYDDILKLVAQQQITVDTLAYHLQPPKPFVWPTNYDPNDQNKFGNQETIVKLMNDEEVFWLCLILLSSLLRQDDPRSVYSIVYMLREAHRPNTFHNWRHSVATLQSFHVLMKASDYVGGLLDHSDVVAIAIAAISHCLDYRPIASSSGKSHDDPLRVLYRTCTQQHHSFQQLRIVTHQVAYSLIKGLADLRVDFTRLMAMIESLVISTDDDVQLKKVSFVSSLISEGERHWLEPIKKDALRCTVLAAAYMNSEYKDWSKQMSLEHKILELSVGSQIASFDMIKDNDKRLRMDNMEQLLDYFDRLVIPTFTNLAKIQHTFMPFLNAVQSNRKKWGSEFASLQADLSGVRATSLVNDTSIVTLTTPHEVKKQPKGEKKVTTRKEDPTIITDFMGTMKMEMEMPMAKEVETTIDSLHEKATPMREKKTAVRKTCKTM